MALFEDQLTKADTQQSPFTAVELACAVLLIEVAKADDNFSDAERTTLSHILQHQFHITAALIDQLIATAEQAYTDSIDHFQFTQHINKNFDYPGRLKFIAALWRLAYTDLELDMMEEHRIRRFCDLLFIDHSDFIRLKLQARDTVDLSK